MRERISAVQRVRLNCLTSGRDKLAGVVTGMVVRKEYSVKKSLNLSGLIDVPSNKERRAY